MKRRKHPIPDFSSTRASPKDVARTPAPTRPAATPPAPRVKPQSTSAKSGRRGT